MKHVLDHNIFMNLPASDFKPPELNLNPPVLGHHCDVYSVGKVLETLFFNKINTKFQEDHLANQTP